MTGLRLGRSALTALCTVAALCGAATPAQAAASDPIFVYVPAPPTSPFGPFLPPPVAYFYGPCGMGVDSSGRFYVSDYYHHVIDVFQPSHPSYTNPSPSSGFTGYITQIANVDPLDGPCGLALDATNNVYVNNYHRNVVKYPPFPSFGSPTTIAGVGVDSTHPTGVAVDPVTGNVYVDHRTYIGVYDSSGAAVEDGGEPLRIGDGTLEDGYGVAFSQYPGTVGRLYVPDAATDTVKVYDPAIDKVNPVATIDGSATPNGEFVSLRDSAVAVDRVSGEVYVVDLLQPQYTERPQGIVYVFDSAGGYEGHLKYNITDALPAGLAVDNSPSPTYPVGTQGRVLVTSGNLDQAGVYAYPPGAATTDPTLPPTVRLVVIAGGTGAGAVTASAPALADCATRCEADLRSGTDVLLTADTAEGSSFSGWSGGGCSGTGDCIVRMSEARSVTAEFEALAPPPAPTTGASSGGAASAAATPARRQRAAHRRRRSRRRHHRRRLGEPIGISRQSCATRCG
jgi:DNA-binding beta-propeller fold protein YncE